MQHSIYVDTDMDSDKIPITDYPEDEKIRLESNLHYDEFIDCGPSPPVDETPKFSDYYSFEDLGSDLTVNICYNTIEQCLRDYMRNTSGNVGLLDRLSFLSVTEDNLHELVQRCDQTELNICYLWLAFKKRWHLLDTILQLGAELHCTEPSQGLGALHLTSFSGCIQGAQLLIELGCDVNALSKFYSPLHCAAFGNSAETASLLLSHGADLKALTKSLDQRNESVLHCAVRANAPSCVRLFIHEGADVGQSEFSDMSPIHLAADLGYTVCLQFLLEAKSFNVNVKTMDKEYTALHLASRRGYEDCVEMLLQKGANPNIKNHMKQTPLHLACTAQSYDCVHLLLTKGQANPNVEDCDKRTPLHAAVGTSARSPDIIEDLIKHGASKNVSDQYGYTALHVAASRGLPQCVEILILHGADLTAKSKSGLTALSIITKKVPASFAMFKKTLDSAISLHQSESSNHEIELRLDFRIMLQSCHPKEINFLNTLVEEGYKKILLHPLCSTLLYLKWEKIRKYYIARMVFCFIFVMSLTLYVLTALAHHCYNYGKNFHEMNPEEIIELCEKQSIMGRLLRDNPFVIEMQWFVLVGITACEIVRKIYGMPGYSSIQQYFSYPENIIEWAIISSVFVISFIYTGRTYTWQNHVGAFAVLLSWTNLMLMIGQLPLFESYVAMYTRLQSEFAKLLLAYSGVIIGFTLSFCVMFPDSRTFANPFISLIAIIVMMSGELNLDILVDDNPENPPYLLEVSAQVTYALFVLSVTIILMNLLVGIAVDDIKGLQKTAQLSKLVRQTKLIAHMELALFNGSVPRYMKRHFSSALVSTRTSQVVLNLMPLNPKEKRIPKNIMKAAFEIAIKRDLVHTISSPNVEMEYYWFNSDADDRSALENDAVLAKLEQEIEKKNDEIQTLVTEVNNMKNAFISNQDILEQLLRSIANGRRGSKC